MVFYFDYGLFEILVIPFIICRPAYPHHAVMWSSLPQNVEFGNEMWSFNAAPRSARIRLKVF